MKQSAAVLFFAWLCSGGCARAPERNLIVITIDTLRADRLGACGYLPARTPRLDAVARSGFLFPSGISPVPLTLPAHTTIFTGKYPPAHQVRNNGDYRLSSDQTTLAEILQRRGYHTGAIVASFVLNRCFGLDQGFDQYDDRLGNETGSSLFLFREIKAEQVTDKAIAWLKRRKEPFFLWVHYFDLHADYNPPEPFRSQFPSRPYDGEVAYVDFQIGRLLDFLESLDSAGRTLLVIASDHGEGLGDHGEPTHGFLVYQTTLKVPIIFRGPAIAPGRSSYSLGLVDLVPTILSLLGFPPPAGVQGKDAASLLAGKSLPAPELYFETLAPQLDIGWSPLKGVMGSGWKYILAPRPELYCLDADPGEENNLTGADPVRAAEFLQKFADLEKRIAGAGGESVDRPALRPEARELLSALGYGGGSGSAASLPAEMKDPKDMLPVLGLLAQSETEIREGRLGKAEQVLVSIVRQDPANRVAWERLVVVYRLKHQLEKALAAVEQVIALHPRNRHAQLIKAEILRQQGNLAQAESAVRQGLVWAPEDPPLWVMLAKLCNQGGRLDEARSAVDEALRLDPASAPARINLAEYYCRKGNWEAAESILARILEADPRHPDAHYNLGVLYLERGNQALGRRELEQALQLDPGHELTRQKLEALSAAPSPVAP